MEKVNPFLTIVQKKLRDTKPSVKCSFQIRRKKTRQNNKIIDKLCFIIPFGQCYWNEKYGGCTFCGFRSDKYTQSQSKTIFNLIKKELEKLYRANKEVVIDFYTSGSFLNSDEIPDNWRNAILSLVDNYPNIREVYFESRPEFITIEKLQLIRSIVENTNISIGIGLETSNDIVRIYCMNKGFMFEDFRVAADKISKFFTLHIYVLLKPPFIGEKNAIQDVLKTLHDTKKCFPNAKYVLMPVSIYNSTLVYFLWKKNIYRPPWLWSILEIIKESPVNLRIGGLNLTPHPLASPTNCDKCDNRIYKIISDLNNGKELHLFEKYCSCKKTWQKEIKFDRENLKTRIERGYEYITSEFEISQKVLTETFISFRKEIQHQKRVEICAQ